MSEILGFGELTVRIAIDMRALPRSGIGNYSRILLNGLPKLFPNIKTIPVSDEITIPRQQLRKVYSSRLKRLIWEQVELPNFLSEYEVDILHNPMNYGIPIKKSSKVIVTIHDVIPLVLNGYLNTFAEKSYYKAVMNIAIIRSDKIITDSYFSRDEIIKHFSISPKKIEVVYLGCGEEFKPISDQTRLDIVRNKFGLIRPFVMTIGGNEPRKNVNRLICAFQEIGEKFGLDLVVVGGNWRGNEVSPTIRNIKNVAFLGSVDQEELVCLYNLAELFVFPSLYEGFGLPILESMTCGTPVIASNTSSIPEVAGDAALLFDPLDQNNIVDLMRSILFSKGNKEELIAKGFERSTLFSWERTLKETMAIYQEITV